MKMVEKLLLKGQAQVDPKKITQFIQEASHYKSNIFIEKEDRKANGKSFLGVFSLKISGGDKISLIVEGEDEKLAIKDLKGFIMKNFYE